MMQKLNIFFYRVGITVLLFSGLGFRTIAQQPTPVPYQSHAALNYVRTWDAVKPDTSNSSFSLSSNLTTARIVTQYSDGLNRPVQTVIKQGSLATGSMAYDLVTTNLYDPFGREEYKYLPFSANAIGGNTSLSDGLFKLNPFQQDSTFNKNQFSDESWFYSRTVFEASPLSRQEKVMAPGNNWVGASRGLETKYLFNTTADSVRIWNVTDVANNFGTYSSSAFYLPKRLYKTITIDEYGKQVIEFKDKGGRVILKKIQLTAEPDTGTGKGYYGWICIYYIYDYLSQLRCIVQPKGVELLISNEWTFSSDIVNEQSFRYEYDKHGQIIFKKMPGGGVIHWVYDARDRLVMTQDSAMRAAHKWLYTQFDELNRSVATGLLTDNTFFNNAVYHRGQAENSTSYPSSGSYIVDTLTKTFYDDYSWRQGQGNPLSATINNSSDGSGNSHFFTASNSVAPYPQPIVQSAQLKGMVTGEKIKVLDINNTYLYNVNFYDERSRIAQVQNTNVAGGTDVTTLQYAFTGQPLISVTKNEKPGTNAQTSIAITKVTYDDLERILRVDKKVSNTKVNSGAMPGSWTTVVQNEYDPLGRLKTKRLGNGLDSSKYDYNIRGWLLGMNRSYVKDTTSVINYFGFDLGYDKPTFIVNGSSKSYAAPQYNGNIAGMLWKSTGDDQLRKYDFAYDYANRLIGADFNQLTNNSFSKAAGIDFSAYGLNYDVNGNILNMNQKGWRIGGSLTIDSLLYTYVTNSNKLLNVIDRKNDTLTKLNDFRSSTAYMVALGQNKTTSATDYGYDPNGNMTLDKNKDITHIRYNHLNLPDSITVGGKGHIKYVYDGEGNKLKKITTEGSKVTTTLYLFGNYINDTLQFIEHEEGKIRFNQATNSLQYDYFLKDHLGNIRMVLTEEQQNDPYPIASLEGDMVENEKIYYGSLDSGRIHKNTVSGYPNDGSTSPNNYIQRLNGNGPKVGANLTLKVMAGDKFNLRATSWWNSGNTPASPIDPLNSILGALTGSIGAITTTHGGATTAQLQSGNVLSSPIADFLSSHSGYTTSKPKAFINWVLFDEQFKYVAASSGFVQVGNSNVFTEHVPTHSSVSSLTMSKSGYLYVYVSNETPNIDVYFDNLQVTHLRGPILEETHYYPFGLTMAGISSKAFGKTQNKYKFNDASELANKEFSDGSGLELYETPYRGYDPQIGRFQQLDPLAFMVPNFSPYVFANNNPILLNDRLGLLGDTITLPEVIVECKIPKGMNRTVIDLPEVIVESKIPKGLDYENGQVYEPHAKIWDMLNGPRIWEGHITPPGFKGNGVKVLYYVDHNGYIDPRPVQQRLLAVNPPVDFSPLKLRAVFRLKNFFTGQYNIYRAIKNSRLYIGKAKDAIKSRYTAAELAKIEAQVIAGLDKVPNNAIALGIEQLVIDLNGGVDKLANINNATIKEIYINEARHWLNLNLPDWEILLKFQ